MDRPHLEQSARPPHSNTTCGQSRRGGLVTSHCERRSSFLGRVVVAHVQGSPKGGDALGSLGVTSTRLCPVPPSHWEAHLRLGERHNNLAAQGRCSLQNAVRGPA